MPREHIVKPHGPGGPGYKTRRLGPFWRWHAWAHENTHDPNRFEAKGWARTERSAEEQARKSLRL